MATGASTADVAILLMDARNGVRTQSKRHARIARLLGIKDFVLAVNKMDLVDYDREVFEKIKDDFSEFLTGAAVHAIPMSALHGDNVITRSDRTPYFDGPPLLEYLETVQVHRNLPAAPFRFPVQMVVRPDDVFRGYAGQIVSGTVQAGDRVTRLALRPSARVKRIVTFDGDLDAGVRADVGDADARRRDRHQPRRRPDLDRTRSSGRSSRPSRVDGRAAARPGRVYLLKQGTRTVTAEVNHALVLNQIGTRAGLPGAAAGVRSLRRESRDGQLHPDRSGDAVHLRRRHDHRRRSRGDRARSAAEFAERLAHMARRAVG